MREERSHTGTVLGPRRPLMKTELKADKGTPAPMARNPAACRPETTVRYGYHPGSGVHEKFGEIICIEQNSRRLGMSRRDR